jgi:hypothetical protein
MWCRFVENIKDNPTVIDHKEKDLISCKVEYSQELGKRILYLRAPVKGISNALDSSFLFFRETTFQVQLYMGERFFSAYLAKMSDVCLDKSMGEYECHLNVELISAI